MFSNLSNKIVKNHMEKQFQGLAPRTLEIIKKTMDTMNTPALKIGTTLIGALIGVFGMSLIIFIIFKISRVSLSYQQAVTLYLVTLSSSSIGYIFKSIYMLISKKAVGINVVLNPSVKNTLIASIDIFTIWQYILLGIGIYTMGKTSKKKAAILTVILAILSIGVAVLPFLVRIKK
ncbi:YIP1 family protein [Clostridium botulinum]|uniref:YIP1 family protein n=1 Tax=Clostridium botulinum TaxID=1491 RepID=A0A846J8Y0_CLOBO|nr:conserved domain protein [Clostridium botulinum A3 str. Loch Maree]NFH66039.1 YIP1 family protein [Clostridium botulinum]NFJ10002.1 YIP1 family protein [Clostridium botulinum]NFK15757.1 YIP1 family protein [Clostridium botulinum]NFM95802.1 YIP1 family protein [Clostridium botulinum]